MDEIRVDDIVIQSQESSLTISDDSRPGLSIILDANNLPEIIEFLSSHRPGVGEKRIGFRVPIASLCQSTQSNFSISLEIAGSITEATALDVSITGVLVEITGHNIKVEDGFPATLQYQDNTAIIGAKVVRIDGSRICLHFPSSLTNGELDPPEALMKVYRALEMDWLKERVS